MKEYTKSFKRHSNRKRSLRRLQKKDCLDSLVMTSSDSERRGNDLGHYNAASCKIDTKKKI